MADRTTGIPQSGATTSITPTNDLQINLENAPKIEKNPESGTLNSEPNLDLSLNLPEAPKTDDRLKEEDQKNMEITTETPKTEDLPATERSPEIIGNKGENEGGVTTETTPVPGEPIPEMENITLQTEEPQYEIISPEENQSEKISAEEMTSSTKIEEVSTEKKEDLPEESNLQKDNAIIKELETQPNAGGLAEEAKIETKPAPAETPKTFDLDAMLGTSAENLPGLLDKGGGPQSGGGLGRIEEGVVSQTLTTPPTIEQKTEIPQMAPETPITQPSMPPAFTIPSATNAAPVQAIMQTTIPQKKTSGIKILLFVMLFVALGFTSLFILKTMYPIEFAGIFGGNNETQMHASEDIAATETLTGETTTGDTETMTGTETTGEDMNQTDTSEEDMANAFGELNDLGTMTDADTGSAETDLSKLTDYVNRGNDLVAQGKAMNNNTVIKYGLYISKKSTDFLTKIANGEQIDNLSGYFAQFDQYIAELDSIITPTVDTPTAEMDTTTDEASSPSPDTTNDEQDMNTPAPEATSE